MALKKQKPNVDKIYVTGRAGVGQHKKSSAREDVILLALQLACVSRIEPGESIIFDNTSEIHNLTAITVETKNFSSLIIVGVDDPKVDVTFLLEPLVNQLRSIIKSSKTKLYFIETFPLIEFVTLEWRFVDAMSDFCFLQETPAGNAYFGYFRLEKLSDEDRFASRSVESMNESEVAEQDVYLYFKKNNRYIKILKKGDSLEKERHSRLQSKGVTNLYVSADQSVEMQRRRIQHVLFELLNDYSSKHNAV